MKKRWILAVLLVLILILTACKGPSAGNNTPGNNPSGNNPSGNNPSGDNTSEGPKSLALQYDDYVPYENAQKIVSADPSIVAVEDKTLHAVGLGSTTVTIDGTDYSVNVEKAKLAVLYCIGQSNMTVISTGSEELAIKPALGTAYWSTVEDSTSLSVTGVKGLFGAIADGWYKNTGEKCLLIPAAFGGTSISQWQRGQEYLNIAISKYKASAENLKTHLDHYEITRCGYLWLQGETDCRLGMSSAQYVRSFFSMNEMLVNECEPLIEGAEEPFSFIGILGVRSWSGLPGYERPANIVFSGPRAAQYTMASSDTVKVGKYTYDTSNIYLITNITEQWYSDESVAAYFASDALYYEQDRGIVKMIGETEHDLDALMPPYISSASNTTYPDQHYLQKAYNEMGADAAKNLANILKAKEGKTDPADYGVVLRGFNGIDIYHDGDSVKINSATAKLIPCVTNLSAEGYVLTCTFTSDACPEATIDCFGQINGLQRNASGTLKVFLNGSSEPVLTVQVTMTK